MIESHTFQKILLTWFNQHGRKNLPWQQNKTAYRVWISEIMLQQTQVSTVIPYFSRFIDRFPNIFQLANADEDEVLHFWTGLGYYSRARNLHRTAKLIATNFAGHFPQQAMQLQAFPGIGQSSAGAISAIAFNQATPILDGNVKRVLSRVFGIKEPINEKKIEAELWSIATNYTSKDRPADYTQAMMDLGATVCTRNKPHCYDCPFKKHCIACRENLVEQIPAKKKARTLPFHEATFLVIECNHQFLLERRPAKGIWGGLFSFPEIMGKPDEQTLALYCQKNLRIKMRKFQILPHFRHAFTHFHLDIFPVRIKTRERKLSKAKSIDHHEKIWYNPQKSQLIGLPKPTLIIMRSLRDVSSPLRKIKKTSRRIT